MPNYQKILRNVEFNSTWTLLHIEAIDVSQKCNFMRITVIYPHTLRKHLWVFNHLFLVFLESADSSSDDNSLSDTANPLSSKDIAHGSNMEPTESPSQSPTRFPIPSTSTGITGNGNSSPTPFSSLLQMTRTHFFIAGTLFRIAQTPDSDDDPTPQNSPPLSRAAPVNTVPIKMNGGHILKSATTTDAAAVAYSSGVDDEQPNEIRHSRRKRNHSLTNSFHYAGNLSSHSSSRLSDSSSSDDDDATSNDDSFVPFFRSSLSKRQKTAFDDSHGPQHIERTPVANRSRDYKDCEFTPDSGIAVTPCPGSSGISSTHNFNKHFSDGNNNDGGGGSGSRTNAHKINGDESLTTSIKLFQQSMARIRRNFRNIGDASFSEDSDWTIRNANHNATQLFCRIYVRTAPVGEWNGSRIAIDENWKLNIIRALNGICCCNRMEICYDRSSINFTIMWIFGTIGYYLWNFEILAVSRVPTQRITNSTFDDSKCAGEENRMRCDDFVSAAGCGVTVMLRKHRQMQTHTQNIIILELINQFKYIVATTYWLRINCKITIFHIQSFNSREKWASVSRWALSIHHPHSPQAMHFCIIYITY